MKRFPSVGLSLAAIDYQSFASSLHEAGDVFLLEPEGRVLVCGYELVSMLLADCRLTAERRDVLAALKSLSSDEDAARFYSDWLMYQDGKDHQQRRLILDLAVRTMTSSSVGLVLEDAALAALSSKKVFGSSRIDDFLTHAFAHLLAIKKSDLVSALNCVEPLINLVHGKDADLVAARTALKQWPSVCEKVRSCIKHDWARVGLPEHWAQLLLPCLDVFRPMETLLWALTDALVGDRAVDISFELRDLVAEISRLHQPFRIVNRLALQDLNFEGRLFLNKGSKVTLGIGIANRDPEFFHEPSKLKQGRSKPPLTFGLGRHSCPGKDWTYRIMAAWVEALRRWPKRRTATVSFTVNSSYRILEYEGGQLLF